jgi:hypothetical protein
MYSRNRRRNFLACLRLSTLDRAQLREKIKRPFFQDTLGLVKIVASLGSLHNNPQGRLDDKVACQY